MNADNHFLVLSAFISVHLRPLCSLQCLPMERVPRPPLRQPVLIRDVLAEQQSVFRRLPQRGEIPVALELVRWLVVMLADVLPVGLLAETRRLADEIRGVPGACSRYP